MYRLFAVFAFYKPFIMWSLIANFIVGFFNPNIIPGLITKLFLTIFAWYYIHETNQKRKLTFYKNLGISPTKLFIFIYLIDSIFTILFLTIFKEFK